MMGAWGTAIFSDDYACDVRDDYVKEIIRGKTSEEATEAVKKTHLSTDPEDDDAPVFWIALAITQWKKGRLLSEVKAEVRRYGADKMQDLSPDAFVRCVATLTQGRTTSA